MCSVSNKRDYTLHESFSVEDCTFLSDTNGVVYSPLAAETLLCDQHVIHFIAELELQKNTASVVGDFLDTYPTNGENIISQLVEMKIIRLQN